MLLVINEIWWRRKKKHSELSRKLIHILVGSFVAFWPYIMSVNSIRIISVLFMIVVFSSMKFNIFKSIHSVKRDSLGEIYFAISVGLITFINPSHLVYTISLLTMSLADGLAALVGTYYGMNRKYKVYGRTKTVLGSLTFFIVALVLILIYIDKTGHVFSLGYLAVAAGLTLIENISPKGMDNLLVPLVAALFLAA
jgi:phytol kinase